MKSEKIVEMAHCDFCNRYKPVKAKKDKYGRGVLICEECLKKQRNCIELAGELIEAKIGLLFPGT